MFFSHYFLPEAPFSSSNLAARKSSFKANKRPKLLPFFTCHRNILRAKHMIISEAPSLKLTFSHLKKKTNWKFGDIPIENPPFLTGLCHLYRKGTFFGWLRWLIIKRCIKVSLQKWCMSRRGGGRWEATFPMDRIPMGFVYMGVSENSGFSPKSSIFIGFSQKTTAILGCPYFWKHPYIPTFTIKNSHSCW